ncbi:haloacid dehalogenase-like hydrolase [Blastococcus sp. TF02A-30]|uniref:haloacid dehalogenase-like hydrolase n=1 Tax=Blastococcus sp. TF02A-30 TaxID=2250580 RepID=UPI000DEB1861|nr:haloacid dehalogenase-like hydrolase [Blastococcus sp. TF02A-30]RBY84513.1 hypothetical protein DQ241_17695 [Blastococcus sp. TF02A-30]
MLSGPEVPVLACDLDETLLRVNTFPAFVRFALRQSLVERDVVAWTTLVSAVIKRKLLRGSHVAFKATVHGVGRRLALTAVAEWADGMVQSHLNADVHRLVRSWRGDTVLVTAAPSIYADLIGAQVGFTLVQASDHRAGEYVENVHARKADCLKQVLTGPLQCAITDDPRLDGPLLALAVEPLIVDEAGAVNPYVGPVRA